MNKDLEIINSYIAPKEFDYRRGAFTLAEVLITLGIIGVVAAMTIPTLISNYQTKEQETRYKKAKSLLVNGYKLMLANEGKTDMVALSLLQCNDANCIADYHKKVFKITTDSVSNTNFADTMPEQYTTDEANSEVLFEWGDVPYSFTTTDGVTYGYQPDESLTEFFVFADVNGATNPNKVAKDFYKFRIDSNSNISDVTESLVTGKCSTENPTACTTETACNALGTPSAAGSWYRFKLTDSDDGSCLIIQWRGESGCYVNNSANMYLNHYCQ